MRPARLGLLALGAVLVIAAALWVSSMRELPPATLAGERVLPGLAADVAAIGEIRLARGDGNAVTLRKDGEQWLVAERSWPADAAKLRKLVIDLADLAIVEEKTQDAARYGELGVEDVAGPEARGTLLEIKGPATARSLIVGKPSGANAVFVRVPGKAASALARPQLTPDAQPQSWLDRRLLALPAERIRALQLVGGRKRAEPAGAKSQLVSLEFEDVRSAQLADKARDKAGKPVERLRVETGDGLVVELAGVHEGERRFVALTASAAVGAKPEIEAEAKRLQSRTDGREFELPVYRYEAIFPPAGG